MGLALDGVPVGVAAAEAPPLGETLARAAEIARDAEERGRVRDLHPVLAGGPDSSRVVDSLRAIGLTRQTNVEKPVPPDKRNFSWDLRAPNRKAP